MPIISGGGGGGGAVLTKTVTLTNAQVLSLVSTPVELIAAPGANKIITPIYATFVAKLTAVYTNVSAYDPATNPGAAAMGLVLDATNNYNSVSSQIPAQYILAPAGGAGTYFITALGGFFYAGGTGLGLSGEHIYSEGSVGVVGNGYTNAALSLAVNSNALGAYAGGNAANTLTGVVYYVVTATA